MKVRSIHSMTEEEAVRVFGRDLYEEWRDNEDVWAVYEVNGVALVARGGGSGGSPAVPKTETQTNNGENK